MDKATRRGVVIVAVGFVLLLVVIANPFVHAWGNKAVASPPAAKYACSDVQSKPKYLAKDAATKLDNFGPAVTQIGKANIMAVLHKRRCLDPLLTATHAATYHLAGYTYRNARTKAAYLYDHPVAMGKLVRRIEKVESRGTVSLGNDHGGSLWTLWFQVLDNPKAVPALAQGTVDGRASRTVVVRNSQGKVLAVFRLICGFQPEQKERFPHVPPLHHKVPTHKKVHHDKGGPPPACKPTSTHSCGHTPTCQEQGTCKPPKKCNCVTKAQASQAPLPAPKNDWPNTPTKEPKAQPTVPANTSNPAPPKSGGYNGGSTQQPGQAGTPDPVVPTSDPTNTSDPGDFGG